MNDELVINGTLTLSGDTYRINLSAPDIGFDANNPLNSGSFAVAESDGDLYLEFSPVPYTALELWRFQKFGSYSNSGDAADSANPDLDARDNLLEYGVGSDPTVYDSNSVSTAGITADRMTLTFNRIVDPALTYRVYADTNLVSASWPAIWTSTGASNTAGSVTVEDTESISNHWNRFMRLKISY